MRRLLFALMAFGLSLQLSPAQVAATTNVSRPVVVNGLRFVARLPARWAGNQGISLQLLITNTTKHSLTFPTFDTFSFDIRAVKGDQLGILSMRLATFYTPPLEIAPGASSSVSIDGSFISSSQQKGHFKAGDGTGSRYEVLDVGPGHYLLKFYVTSSADEARKNAESFRRPMTSNEPLWSGKCETKEVSFEILPP